MKRVYCQTLVIFLFALNVEARMSTSIDPNTMNFNMACSKFVSRLLDEMQDKIEKQAGEDREKERKILKEIIKALEKYIE